jgi:F-type H+-transporting ATPase subunit gamma
VATLRDIQRRIRAVKSTRQITKAMKMVAAAKLRRAQGRMLELRPYADKMAETIASLAAGAEHEAHPLLDVRPRKSVEMVAITSDRGLCGAFNTNVMRAAARLMEELRGEAPEESISAEGLHIGVSVVGKKARDYYRRREVEMTDQWMGLAGTIDFGSAQEIAAKLIERYVAGETDEVYLVYNQFKNVAQQEVQTVKLLPTTAEAPEEGEQRADFIYEPTAAELLDVLLPKNVEVQVYRGLLESRASEEAARMTAMENATKAANEMIETLTLQYNKARQASITAELMDIVGGVEALKHS